MGEKFLSFNNDKNFLVKATFIRFLPRMYYYFTREEKLEYSIIVSRFNKDSDPEIIKVALIPFRSWRVSILMKASKSERKLWKRASKSKR